MIQTRRACGAPPAGGDTGGPAQPDPPCLLEDAALPGPLRLIARATHAVHRLMMGLGMLALLTASLVLTHSVVTRYLFKAATDWQDEAAVFCLVGMTFLCAGQVQRLRGHIGIEAVAGALPARWNALRMLVVDAISLAFCAFFSWKSWTLWHEAWADGQTTSSSWAPPLAIPYGLMAAGMTLLTVQLLLQFIVRIAPSRHE
jgi:TRAP-type C4-dicarboxylate transport system permease small subunit